jgi:hypothetical protein
MCPQSPGRETDEPPAETMLQLIRGFWISRALFVAVKTGIPDLLQDQAKSVVELAAATTMHAPSLNRVLRGLVSVGVLTEDDQGRFALTPLGATLRDGVPGSMRAWALTQLGDDNYQSWGDVLHSVQTGEPAFDHVFGMGVWEYRAEHPEQARIFDEAMANLGNVANEAILESYNFSSIDKLVDVGGGNGSLLIFLLNANPNLKGVVFDAPHVAEGAKQRITAAGLNGRCEVIAGDFFVSVPGGGDAYMLSRIIHDWDDAQAIAILKNCRRAMSPGSKLLLSERVIPSRIEPSTASQAVVLTDLLMMVMTGGRERTEDEFRELFDAAGFRLTRVIPTRSTMSIIEAVPI